MSNEKPFSAPLTGDMGPVAQALEALIDRHGLHDVLEDLACVCHAKADHVESSWQDAGLARRWRRMASMVGMPAVLAEEWKL